MQLSWNGDLKKVSAIDLLAIIRDLQAHYVISHEVCDVTYEVAFERSESTQIRVVSL